MEFKTDRERQIYHLAATWGLGEVIVETLRKYRNHPLVQRADMHMARVGNFKKTPTIKNNRERRARWRGFIDGGRERDDIIASLNAEQWDELPEAERKSFDRLIKARNDDKRMSKKIKVESDVLELHHSIKTNHLLADINPNYYTAIFDGWERDEIQKTYMEFVKTETVRPDKAALVFFNGALLIRYVIKEGGAITLKSLRKHDRNIEVSRGDDFAIYGEGVSVSLNMAVRTNTVGEERATE